MLRCNFQLTADMILTQFFEKRVIRIRQQIVKPDTGTDKYFLTPGIFLRSLRMLKYSL